MNNANDECAPIVPLKRFWPFSRPEAQLLSFLERSKQFKSLAQKLRQLFQRLVYTIVWCEYFSVRSSDWKFEVKVKVSIVTLCDLVADELCDQQINN